MIHYASVGSFTNLLFQTLFLYVSQKYFKDFTKNYMLYIFRLKTNILIRASNCWTCHYCQKDHGWMKRWVLMAHVLSKGSNRKPCDFPKSVTYILYNTSVSNFSSSKLVFLLLLIQPQEGIITRYMSGKL